MGSTATRRPASHPAAQGSTDPASQTNQAGQAAPRDLAVVLHDLAWLLPRTVGLAAARQDPLPQSELEVMRLLIRRPGLSVNDLAPADRRRLAEAAPALRRPATRLAGEGSGGTS
jgi:hypothetical protein